MNSITQIKKAVYETDEIKRILPRIKDCRSVRTENGEKIKLSIWLILYNLMEAYGSFKEKFLSMKLSFSKFAELRPVVSFIQFYQNLN